MEAAAREGGGLGRPPRQATGAVALGVERITEGTQPPGQLSAQHRGDAKVCTLYSSKREDQRGRHLPSRLAFPWGLGCILAASCASPYSAPLAGRGWPRPPSLCVSLWVPRIYRSSIPVPHLPSALITSPDPSTHNQRPSYPVGERRTALGRATRTEKVCPLLPPSAIVNPPRKLRPKGEGPPKVTSRA